MLAQLAPRRPADQRRAKRRRSSNGYGFATEPAAHQREMQHNQVETALRRIGHAEGEVEGGVARLRHDRAIEGVNGGRCGAAAKQPKNHASQRVVLVWRIFLSASRGQLRRKMR